MNLSKDRASAGLALALVALLLIPSAWAGKPEKVDIRTMGTFDANLILSGTFTATGAINVEGTLVDSPRFKGQSIHIDRTMTTAEYWPNIQKVISWCDKYDATGVLFFEGNDTYVQPWLAAAALASTTKSLCPLVAVNPIYMHPYTAAKMVTSLAYLHGRKTYLNMITGTALSYLDALHDKLDKEQRYDRLREYAEVIALLTKGDTNIDAKVRVEAYREAHRLITERAYAVPLYALVTWYVQSKDLVFKPYPDELPRFWEMKWK